VFGQFSGNYQCCSWFQTFAVFWMLYSFFWVIPRLLNFMCQRFRTLFHIHRRCKHSSCVHRLWSWNRVFWTSAHKIQTPGNHPKERIQQSVVFLPYVTLSVTRTNTMLYRCAYWVRVLLRIDSDILNTAVLEVLWSRPKIPSYIIVSLVKCNGEVFRVC
jgi:hypothetical protein